MLLEPVLLTTAEAAVYLRYSSATIYALIHKGKLNVLKRGKCYYIPRSSLDAYLALLLGNKK
jgi:excisionase family DNA binding protein